MQGWLYHCENQSNAWHASLRSTSWHLWQYHKPDCCAHRQVSRIFKPFHIQTSTTSLCLPWHLNVMWKIARLEKILRTSIQDFQLILFSSLSCKEMHFDGPAMCDHPFILTSAIAKSFNKGCLTGFSGSKHYVSSRAVSVRRNRRQNTFITKIEYGLHTFKKFRRCYAQRGTVYPSLMSFCINSRMFI